METSHLNEELKGLGTGQINVKRFLRIERYTLISILTVVIVLTVWIILTETHIINTFNIPSPQQLFSTLMDLLRNGYEGKPLWMHTLASLLRALIGFIAAVIFGVPIGVWAGLNRNVSAVIAPFVGFLRPIPPISFITLFIFYFGIGEFAKVFLIFLTGLWYVILNSEAGIKSVPKDLIRAGQNIGMNKRQLFFNLMIPAALPYILAGMRTALALSWTLVVAAELIAAQVGLGYLIMDATTFFRIPVVYIGIIIIGLIGLILEGILLFIERRALHWRGQ